MIHTTIPEIKVTPPPKDNLGYHIGDANDLSEFNDLFVRIKKSNPL